MCHFSNKGVQVELGIPYELWDKPSAEVSKMHRAVSLQTVWQTRPPADDDCLMPSSILKFVEAILKNFNPFNSVEQICVTWSHGQKNGRCCLIWINAKLYQSQCCTQLMSVCDKKDLGVIVGEDLKCELDCAVFYVPANTV